jgi:prevent-host-death family protein
MSRSLTVEEARGNLDAALDLVEDGPVILSEQGEPRAVLLSPEDFDRYREFVKQRFFETVDRIHERNAGVDPDELMREVADEVEAVRRERRARRR